MIDGKTFKKMQYFQACGYSIKQIAVMYDMDYWTVKAKFNEFKRGLI